MPALDTGAIHLPSLETVGVGSTALPLNALNDYVSSQAQIPRTGTITGIKFATSTVTTGATITATIETITDAKPSGTLIDANATGSVVVANTDDSVIKEITFAGDVSVTRGDFVSVRFQVTAGTPNTLNMRTNTPQASAGFPYSYSSVAPGWSQAQLTYCFVYDDGEYSPLGVLMYRTNVNVVISSSTSPDEAGIKFTMPYSASVQAFYWRTTTAANARDVDMVLYDSSDNVVASQSFSKEMFETASAGLNNTVKLLLDADVNILKGRTYRLVLKPTTTTSWTNIFQTMNDPLVADDGIVNPVYTYRADAGAWTDDSTRIIPIGLVINKIYQPGGSFL